MAPVTKRIFGKTRDGEPVYAYQLDDGKIKAEVISYGAALRTLLVPDSKGNFEDVVLGHDSVAGYEKGDGYLGVTVGRVANRIAQGKFSVAGKTYQLEKNNGENALHGGLKGLSKSLFSATIDDSKENTVHMGCTSPDGEDGYPGSLTVNVTYSLDGEGGIAIEYKALTTAPTPVNLTNHSHFNLAGHGSGLDSIHDHFVTLNADKYTPISAALIPTGEIAEVAGTPFDLRKRMNLGEAIGKTSDDGFDNNFCINGGPAPRVAAELEHEGSGRVLEVVTDQPGIQFYTDNFMPRDGSMVGKGGAVYQRHGGFCLETQAYPDAVNHANFLGVILSPGQVYTHVCKYKFSCKK